MAEPHSAVSSLAALKSTAAVFIKLLVSLIACLANLICCGSANMLNQVFVALLFGNAFADLRSRHCVVRKLLF